MTAGARYSISRAAHGEEEALLARKRAVLEAERAQPFGAPPLHEAQIGSVIDAAGKIRVLVVHAQIQVLAWRFSRHRARGFAASIGAIAPTDWAKVDPRAASRKEATRLLTLRARDVMRRAMRVIFMGAPEFATPTLSALVEQGHEVVAVYTRAPQPAGRRGLESTKTPVHRLAEARSLPVVTTATLRNDRSAGRVSRLRRGCRGRRRLWAHPAACRARRAEVRLPQHSRFAAAALARRGAGPARDHGRRRRDRRRPHAHGGRPRHRPGRPRGAHPDPPERHGRRPHGNPRRARRQADRGGLAGPRGRTTEFSPAEFAGRDLRAQDRKERSADRLDRSTRSACATTSTASPPRPAPMARSNAADGRSASRFCAPKSSTAPGHPARSSTPR